MVADFFGWVATSVLQKEAIRFFHLSMAIMEVTCRH